MKCEREIEMNKILLDSTISYDKEGIYKQELEKDTVININNSNIKLYLLTKESIKIIININSEVEIYNFTTTNLDLTLNLLKNAKVKFYQMTITDKRIKNIITATHQYQETISNLICNGISYGNGNLSFIVNGIIKKGNINSICNQTSRIINIDGGKSLIEPNLFIDEYDSLANHSAYTGPFDEKTLFYLESKGIKEEEAFKLLLKGLFKKETLPKDYEEIIDQILIKALRR
mgnify:CR=1 FL=1